MPKHYETVVLECGCYCGCFKVCVCSLERRFEFAIRRKITLRKTLDFFFRDLDLTSFYNQCSTGSDTMELNGTLLCGYLPNPKSLCLGNMQL